MVLYTPLELFEIWANISTFEEKLYVKRTQCRRLSNMMRCEQTEDTTLDASADFSV